MGNYVTFELAKKLKEKGFDELCLLHYTNEQELVQNSTQSTIGNTIGVDDMLDSYNRFNNDYTDAPAISQVLKWLREKKGLYVDISLYKKGYCTLIYETNFPDDKDYANSWYVNNVDITYEEAAISGIEYVVDNLI